MVNFTIKDSRKTEFILHPSTRSAAHILEQLREEGAQPQTLMDLGCGSGILALCMAELWPTSRIIASDISSLAVSEAKENVQENGALVHISCVQAEGLDHQLIRDHMPFDLIVANLVAELQTRYIADIRDALAPSGHAILSGILEWRMQEMEAAIHHSGMELVSQVRADNWMTLLLRHANKTAS